MQTIKELKDELKALVLISLQTKTELKAEINKTKNKLMMGAK